MREEGNNTEGKRVRPFALAGYFLIFSGKTKRISMAAIVRVFPHAILSCTMVMTTFPRACPSSRYRRASGFKAECIINQRPLMFLRQGVL